MKTKSTDIPNMHRDMTGADIHALVGASPFIIEVGANDGQSTDMFLKAMPKATILCFEPEPSAIGKFRGMNFDNRVRLYEWAIADRFQLQRDFHCSGGIPDCNHPDVPWNKSGSLPPPKEHLNRSPEITYTRTIKVSTRTLDSFTDDMQLPVDFLWCDVQGSEPLVILGGQRTLRQTKYAIFEYYDQEMYERQADIRGLTSFLPDFDPIAIYGENILFRNRTLT